MTEIVVQAGMAEIVTGPACRQTGISLPGKKRLIFISIKYLHHMASTLTAKLKLPEAPARLLFYKALEGYAKGLDLPKVYDIQETLKGKFKWAQLFAHNIAELEAFLPKVYAVCEDDAIIWLSYPKGTSKLKSDLTRDKGWDILKKITCQWLVLISINDDWSAFAIRKGEKAAAKQKPRGEGSSTNDRFKPWIDNETRAITLPDDVKKALNTHKAAKVYYETLAYSHKREYIMWIVDAKKEETRASRIEKFIERLETNKKNLTVK